MGFYEIDENGFFVKDAEEQSNDTISVQPPQNPSFIRAKWDGTQWLEGATQADIDSTKIVSPPSDVEMLQQQNAQLLLTSAQQSQTISDLQNQNAAIMLQLAQIQPTGGVS